MIQTAKITIGGQEFSLRYPHSPLMEQVILGTLQHEYPFLPFLKDEPGIILDVGANVGCATVLFHACYPRATVLAFEPARETFDFLHANTANLSGVRVFPYGLFDRDGTARLYHGKEGSVAHSLGRSAMGTDAYEDVAVRRISTVLDEQGIGRINLLKLDAEGAEVSILRDVEDRLDRVQSIFVEYHSERDRREIDHILAARFVLYGGKTHRPHLGVLAYVAQEIVAQQTPWESMAIKRPQL